MSPAGDHFSTTLRGVIGDEVLYRDLMQAHDQAGNRSGVEAVMGELRRTVDAANPTTLSTRTRWRTTSDSPARYGETG